MIVIFASKLIYIFSFLEKIFIVVCGKIIFTQSNKYIKYWWVNGHGGASVAIVLKPGSSNKFPSIIYTYIQKHLFLSFYQPISLINRYRSIQISTRSNRKESFVKRWQFLSSACPHRRDAEMEEVWSGILSQRCSMIP